MKAALLREADGPADPRPAQPAAYRPALVALVLASYAVLVLWPDVMIPLGIGLPGDRWFIDIYALLASSDAFALGLDPYKPNPLDWLHVPHWYTDWWFWLHNLGLSRADTPWLGTVIGGSYVTATLALVRPRDFAEMLTGWLVIAGPVAMLGVNRANPDLLIFAVFTALAWLLTSRSRAHWLLGAPLIACMTGLKFYPLAGALALPFAPRVRKEIWASLGLMAGLTVLLALGLYDDVRRVAALIEAPREFYAFGGAQLFILAGLSQTSAFLITVGVGAALALVWWIWTPERPVNLPDREVVAFVLGAATIIGCFIMGVGYSYRLVFAVLMLPLLGTLRLQPSTAVIRRLTLAGLAGILIMVWYDGLFCLGWNLTLGAIAQKWTAPVWSAAFLTGALLSWIWIGAMIGLSMALARPVLHRLCFAPENRDQR
jgi:hypothetical protein